MSYHHEGKLTGLITGDGGDVCEVEIEMWGSGHLMLNDGNRVWDYMIVSTHSTEQIDREIEEHEDRITELKRIKGNIHE